MSGMTDAETARLLQIRRAHASARPKKSNPAWANTHGDLSFVLSCMDKMIERSEINAAVIASMAEEGVALIAERDALREAAGLEDGWVVCKQSLLDEINESGFQWKHRAEAAEMDARRYRWLRAHTTGGYMQARGGFYMNCDEPQSEWDASIDRAQEGKA